MAGARKLLICTAMLAEARALRVPPELAGVPAEVRVIGIGAKGLEPNMLAGACGVLLAGLAGGLDPSLVTGDIVLEQSFATSVPRSRYRRGAVLTRAKLVASAEEKAELFRETGALAVDMEGEVVQRVAREAGVPYIGVRAICDTAQQSLPEILPRLIDNVGRPRLLAVCTAVLCRPGLAGELWRIRSWANVALANLRVAVNEVASAAVASGLFAEAARR